jgi:hypothetical protein
MMDQYGKSAPFEPFFTEIQKQKILETAAAQSNDITLCLRPHFHTGLNDKVRKLSVKIVCEFSGFFAVKLFFK